MRRYWIQFWYWGVQHYVEYIADFQLEIFVSEVMSMDRLIAIAMVASSHTYVDCVIIHDFQGGSYYGCHTRACVAFSDLAL